MNDAPPSPDSPTPELTELRAALADPSARARLRDRFGIDPAALPAAEADLQDTGCNRRKEAIFNSW